MYKVLVESAENLGSSTNMEQSLEEQLSQLLEIQACSSSFDFWRRLPIIDDTKDKDVIEIQENDTPGLKQFKASVQKEIQMIQSHLASNDNQASEKPFTTNSLYFIALWREVLTGARPILALSRTFSLPSDVVIQRSDQNKKKGNVDKVKVDVVADNGHSWIRVNTTKKDRLSAEFRAIEAFQYDSGSDEDEPGLGEDDAPRTLPDDAYLDNTVYEMGSLLIQAAKCFALENGFTPTVHLRLTRLDDPQNDLNSDRRIAHTILKLRNIGVNVHFDTPCLALNPTQQTSPPTYMPRKINIDLSILIALVTDITHAPLPNTEEEAEERFRPQTERSWKRQLEKRPEAHEDTLFHCMALASQTCHEMKGGMVEIITQRLSQYASDSAPVEFWTTHEAKERFFGIIRKIGGPTEQRRAEGLFGENDSEVNKFWEGSRLEKILDWLPIRLFPTESPPLSSISQETFHGMLASTCRGVLVQPSRPDTRGISVGRTVPAPSRFAARLSAHTVRSLLWGATENMVTLTSNKTSVRALLREMRGFGLPSSHSANVDVSVPCPYAVWILEPRSLAEGMRTDTISRTIE